MVIIGKDSVEEGNSFVLGKDIDTGEFINFDISFVKLICFY